MPREIHTHSKKRVEVQEHRRAFHRTPQHQLDLHALPERCPQKIDAHTHSMLAEDCARPRAPHTQSMLAEDARDHAESHLDVRGRHRDQAEAGGLHQDHAAPTASK